MILDSDKFIKKERPHWKELERRLNGLDGMENNASSPDKLLELHALYRRAASGLVRLEAASADPQIIAELETLVGRSYAEIHSQHTKFSWKAVFHWLAFAFPIAFRRQFRSFALALWITFAGCLVGVVAIASTRENREVIYPFPHLLEDPHVRVAKEEASANSNIGGLQATFAAQLMQNNIRVTLNAFALGVTYGIGTVVLLFYNGVILGGVAYDYIADGQIVFLLAWLLPHGVTELPAIFIGGQAGFVLARAIYGGKVKYKRLSQRMQSILPDLVALVFGASVLLIWAGVVESFISQHHQPMIPYAVKIAFGVVELVILVGWLGFAGRKSFGNKETVNHLQTP